MWWVLKFFTSAGYQDVQDLINADDLQEQLAVDRMETIRGFKLIHQLSTVGHTQTMLSFISDALETRAIQNNLTHLETLDAYLIQIQGRISYYESTNSDGIYKRIFWLTAPEHSADLKSRTQQYLQRIDDVRREINANNANTYETTV